MQTIDATSQLAAPSYTCVELATLGQRGISVGAALAALARH